MLNDIPISEQHLRHLKTELQSYKAGSSILIGGGAIQIQPIGTRSNHVAIIPSNSRCTFKAIKILNYLLTGKAQDVTP